MRRRFRTREPAGLLLVASVLACIGAADANAAEKPVDVRQGVVATGSSPLRRYLGRDVARGPRFLDHGVLEVGVAGGTPHLYRVALQLGVLDHLTVGATAHWLPQQRAPGWSPLVALAFWRGRWFEVGAWYHETLHPPPIADMDGESPDFRQRTHWGLSTLTIHQWGASAGFDLGWVQARERDPTAPSSEGPTTQFVTRHRVGGGLHVRLGTRRWGVTFQGLWPHTELEVRLDVRFGLFEVRRRGGWWPVGAANTRVELDAY